MAASTILRVLGGVEVEVGGEVRPAGGPKAQQLLAILTAHRGQPVSMARFIDSLWEHDPPPSATATVQSQISRVRSVLAPGFRVVLTPGGYRLEAVDGEVDADRFEALFHQARAEEPAVAVPLLDAALALWQGEAFSSCAEVAEVRPEALRLDELRLVVTDAWAEARLVTGDPATMVGELQALVERNPLREACWRLLMLALHRSGRQAESLRCAARYRAQLAQGVGLDPSPAVVDLEARILAGDPSLLVPNAHRRVLRRAVAGAPQLQGATSFVGRDAEVEELVDAIREQSLVTIVGPGGVGKTRVAMRVAASAIGRAKDGVTVVELAPLRDPGGVTQVVAAALDIQPRQYRTLESTIADHLAASDSVLVLDNCEHLTKAITPLVDRLRSTCPRVRILATSREPLGLAGEYVRVLAPLTLPDPGAVTADEIRRSSAVELLVARAEVATPGFVLDDANAVAVASICRRLDGLPLALELAAARLRVMDAAALAERLQQRLGLLDDAQRGSDGRPRTLNDLVEWSHALLAPPEQELFEQLSVFAGGFELSAVEAVCAIAPTDAIGTLASLVEKSMVLRTHPTRSRYRLLEPLREFGGDRLRARGGLGVAEERHLDWFRDLAERGAAGLEGPDEASWSDWLARDHDNFRAAHRTALDRGDVDSALRIVCALREYAFRSIQYEITTWADASAHLEGAADHPAFADALGVSAYGRFVRGDMEAAIALARTAVDGAVGADGAPFGSGLPERVLGNALFYLSRTDDALLWMDRMVERSRTSGSDAQLAHALYMRSVAETSVGNSVRGAVLAGEATAVGAASGSPTARAQADYALGLALESTDPESALSHLERAGSRAGSAGNRWIEAFALTEVHWLRARNGYPMAGLAGYVDIVDTWHRGGDWANQWLSLRRVLGILVEVGALEPAAVLHGALTAVGAAHALPFEPAGADELSRCITTLRSELGPSGFAAAVRRGASMDDSEIVAFVKGQIRSITADRRDPDVDRCLPRPHNGRV